MLIDDADVKINEGKSRYSVEGSRPEHGGDVTKKLFSFVFNTAVLFLHAEKVLCVYYVLSAELI